MRKMQKSDKYARQTEWKLLIQKLTSIESVKKYESGNKIISYFFSVWKNGKNAKPKCFKNGKEISFSML